MISIDQFKEGEIMIGKILAVEEIAASEKLLKLTVNFGEENPRTVVSGIRKYFEDPQTLVGTKCAFATNLEPRPLMGIESQAMILAVSTENDFSLLSVKESIPEGTKVR
jgi:methionyl-tRNA synthetase